MAQFVGEAFYAYQRVLRADRAKSQKRQRQNQRSNLMKEIAKMVTMDFNQIFGTMVFIGGHIVPNITLRL